MKTTFHLFPRAVAAIAALVLAFALAACGGGGASSLSPAGSAGGTLNGSSGADTSRNAVAFDINKVTDSAYHTTATLSGGTLTVTVHDDTMAVHQLDDITMFQYNIRIMPDETSAEFVFRLECGWEKDTLRMEDLDFYPNDELFSGGGIRFDYDKKDIVFTATPKAGLDVKNAVFFGGITVRQGGAGDNTKEAAFNYAALRRDGAAAFSGPQTVDGGGLFSGSDGSYLKALSNDYFVEAFLDNSGIYERHDVVQVRSFDEYGFLSYMSIKRAFKDEATAQGIFDGFKLDEERFDLLELDGNCIYYGEPVSRASGFVYKPWARGLNSTGEWYASIP